jgi:prepilin-type N-terminal cleavage/methylation domain-containing protein
LDIGCPSETDSTGSSQARSRQAGFTLIEIIIVSAILVFIGTIGIIAGADAYQRYLFRSDLDTAVALISKARSSAMHSIGETSHGVHFGSDGFVLFRGASYGDDPAFDLFVEKSKITEVTGATEVVFNPPSGESTDTTLTLDNGIQTFVITINSEGGINW